MSGYEAIRLNPGMDKRVRAGHPWVFANEIRMLPSHRVWPAGEPVRLEAADGTRLGLFMFNAHSLIAARLLDRDANATIDRAWIARRLDEAWSVRERLGLGAHCRVVHAEADRLPGLIIDRFGDVFVVQANTAGMDRLLDDIVAALVDRFAPRAVVVRNDSPARAQEGLGSDSSLRHGTSAEAVVEEGGVRFSIDPLAGQKTGWFHDQRPNRALVANLARGGRMLDVFCHVGSFGLQAVAAGAREAILVDASAPALAHAVVTAEANNMAGKVATRRGDAFDVMTELANEGERFEVVVVDPPAFAKSKKDRDAGLRAYARLARLAAPLVARGGYLFQASCSHHAPADAFLAAVAEGIWRGRREGRVLATTGAGPDHPVHPMLPESAYLKGVLLQLV